MGERKRRCVEWQDPDTGEWWIICDDGLRTKMTFGDKPTRDGPSLNLSLKIELSEAEKEEGAAE